MLRLLGADSLEDLGWRKPDSRTLLMPMHGSKDERRDDYLLRLQFLTGREWPPSAQFVNPETLEYKIPDDFHHLPVLTSPEVQVHTQYSAQHGTLQLICCSATFEFYDILHDVQERHLWRETDTFALTIAAIQRAMGSAHYQGRQAPHAG